MHNMLSDSVIHRNKHEVVVTEIVIGQTDDFIVLITSKRESGEIPHRVTIHSSS